MALKKGNCPVCEAPMVLTNLPSQKLFDAMKTIMTRNLTFDTEIPKILYLSVSGLIFFIIGTIAYRIARKIL